MSNMVLAPIPMIQYVMVSLTGILLL